MRETVFVAGSVAALAIAATWPLASHLGTALPSDLADPLLNTFTLAWGADRLAAGLRGFWDAPFFFPAPDALARSEHLLGIAIFTAPVQWATGNAVLAYNLAFLGSYVLAGVGTYLLARSLWQSRSAAWVASVAFAFAPYRVAHISHLQMLVSGWTPLALWGLHGYTRTGSRRALAVLAAAAALQALSCGYLMYFFLLPAVCVALAGLWRRRPGRARLAAGLAVAAAGVFAVLAPVAGAYLRVRGADGLRRSLGDMLLFSAVPSDYWHIPRLAVWAGFLPPARPERELFPGLVVTALALVAVAAGLTALIRKRQAGPGETAGVTMVYGTILLGAVWLSFGPSVPGPYRWLVAWLPGFDGLRVPARIVAVVSLALAVLAGGAVAWASRRLRPLLGALVAAGVSGLVLVEGYAGPMPLAPFDARQLHRRDLNAWLREAPPGGVLELPVAGPGFEPFTMEYQFNTLLHRHPVVNGYSGTGYALQDFLAGAASPLEDEREVAPMLRGLRELGVRYVVLHRSLYLPRQGEDATRILEQAIDGEGEQLASRARFGEAIAWRLADAPPANEGRPPSGTAIPAASLRVSASSAPQTAALAADGNVATRWTSGRSQAGTEWLRVDLPSETDVGQIVLRTVREGHSDRPRRLRVEVQDGAGAGHVLFESSILTETIRSIAHGGSLAPVVIDLPPNRSRAVTLRQTGQASYWYWSVHELELRERPR